MIGLRCWLWFLLALAGMGSAARGADDLRERARGALHAALQEETGWTRVHAAEALLAVGDPEPVRQALATPDRDESRLPERIGIWRVRAALAREPGEKALWIKRIEEVATDSAARDQLQAVESLAKLDCRPTAAVLVAARRLAALGDGESVFEFWLQHLAGEPGALRQLAGRLDSPVPAARIRAAYVLRRLRPDDPGVRCALARAAAAEAPTSIAYPYVLGAAWLLDADPAQMAVWRAALERIATSGAPGARYEADQVLMLARLGPTPDFFRAGLEGTGDVRIGAAWAILTLSDAH